MIRMEYRPFRFDGELLDTQEVTDSSSVEPTTTSDPHLMQRGAQAPQNTGRTMAAPPNWTPHVENAQCGGYGCEPVQNEAVGLLPRSIRAQKTTETSMRFIDVESMERVVSGMGNKNSIWVLRDSVLNTLRALAQPIKTEVVTEVRSGFVLDGPQAVDDIETIANRLAADVLAAHSPAGAGYLVAVLRGAA